MTPIDRQAFMPEGLRHPRRGMLPRIRDGLLLMFLFDLAFGGSLGFVVGGLAIRKLLTVALIGCFFVDLGKGLYLKGWQVQLASAVVTAILVWGGLLPGLRGVDASYAVAESSPLIGLFLALPMAQAMRDYGARRYLDFICICLAILCIVIVSVWFLANYMNAPVYALGLKLFYMVVSGDDFGTYIGPMPDGSFRVMWVTCLLLPFVLFYKNLTSFKAGWTLLLLLAIYATGTRSFLYASFLIVAMSVWRHRPWVFLMSLPLVLVGVVSSAHMLDGIRVFDVLSEFESESARFEQFFSLMRLFADYPVLGAGFGAQADILRSETAPYSYELTYVALLSKVGVVGILGFGVGVVYLMQAAFRRFPAKRIEVVVFVLSLLFITSTNPYLINFVGISLLSFSIAVVFVAPLVKRRQPVLRSEYGG